MIQERLFEPCLNLTNFHLNYRCQNTVDDDEMYLRFSGMRNVITKTFPDEGASIIHAVLQFHHDALQSEERVDDRLRTGGK